MSDVRGIARRGFLRGLAGTAVALPFLPSLARAEDRLAGAPGPRFIALFTANGQQRANFWPAEPEWTVLDETQQVREAPLSAYPAGGMSRVLGPDFDPLRGKLNVIRGLDFVPSDVHGHYPTAMLSGYSRFGQYFETIDQVLARSSKVYPSPQRIRSLHQQVPSPQTPEDPVSVSMVGGVPALVNGIRDARRVFELLFEDVGPTAKGTDIQRARRRWVMDRVITEYRVVATSSRLSSADRHRLDAHATYIHELQKQLEKRPVDLGWCTPTQRPELLLHEEINLPQIMNDHIDVLAAAVRCGLTRVATFQLCDGTDVRTLPFLAEGPIHGGHHQITHEIDRRYDDVLGVINRWYGQQVARFLTRLDEMVDDPETGATVLDNSLVYWGNEFGCNPVHQANAMPVVLAGSAGGQIKTGRYLDYRRHGLRFSIGPGEVNTAFTTDGGMFDWRGRPYNELLVSILQLMGLSPEDYEGLERGFGDYANNQYGKYLFGSRRDLLPYLAG